MNTLRRMIWILAVYSFVGRGCCQEGYLNQDLLRLQQYSDGQGESYSTNFQREPSSQLTSGAQYVNDDVYNNGEYSRAGRSRKVYRIKNPFQHQEEERSLQDTNTSQDSGTAASNQYSALQYSLPPEEFLQQMRAESQYQQQQQQLQQQQQQFSTQVPGSPYTATPQPQYQYSTLPASNYDMNQQSNQISTVEPKSFTPVYQSNTNGYQFSNQNSYNTENAHSTPLPPYMSTSLPSNQYLETPANNYVSSSSSLFVSSPQSSQQYVSSPFSNIHSANYDYNNNRVTTVGSNSLSYEYNNDVSKRMQIDHYDNAATGIRYPDMHSQYQNNFPSTTASPTSTPFTESPRDFWQSSLNSGYNALSKPEQSYQTQYQNFKYNQQEGRYDTESSNSDNHRIGSLQSANNIYLNYAQPDYQFLNSLKDRARDAQTELGQQEIYSHGDYGWKLSDKKSSLEPEISTNNNFFKYQIHSVQPDTGAVSQMSFQMDSRKPYNFDQNSKPVSEKLEVEEFTKAAAKAHENYKQQQQQLEANKYLTNNNYNSNLLSNSYAFNSFHNNEKQRNKLYSDHLNSQGQTQNEPVTASPFFYMNPKDTADSSHKKPFDHDKALKNIVPIDVSNVVQNSDSQSKFEIDLNNRYSFPGFNKEHLEQNVKQYSRPDPYYNNKERDTLYAINLKSKLDDSMEKLKQFEQSLPYYAKQQTSESIHNNYGSNSGNKRFVGDSQQSNLVSQLSNHQDNTHSSANIQQQQHPQFSSDILKFNDIPYRLTPSLHNINFGQSNIPTPLPVRINQNVDNHNVDITAEILAKLLSNKQNMNRPEIDSQSNNLLSINGFRVANPFNVDLKLVADMLKGKPAIDDSQMTSLRGDVNKPMPMDISQLQQFMQLKNENNVLSSNAGFGSYLDLFSSGRLPYQGVKYSRSEEDTENIPITDSSSDHPIGAVVEEDAVNGQEVSDLTENSEDSISTNIDDERPKNMFGSSHKTLPDRHRHLSSLYLSRHSHKRKYPKSEVDEPYPLLKPPPPHSSRYRGLHMKEKNSHRRRANKPKMLRVYKAEPLFESDDVSNMRRSFSVAEEKSDIVNEEEGMTKLTTLAILLSSSYAGILHGNSHAGLSHGVGPESDIGHSAPSGIGSSFEPSSFPVGSLPSATYSSHGGYGGGFGGGISSGGGFGAAGVTGVSLGGGSGIISGPIGAGAALPGTGFGDQAPPPGPRSPVINEIHGLANSNGAPTRYRVRDEPYQVIREVTHRVPQPVPVPYPQPVRVPYPQPYPVQVPVLRQVPVPVVKIQQVAIDKPVPYPVEKIVKIPYEKIIEVPVDHPVPYEKIVEVPVVNLVKVPVPVVKTYPVPVVRTLHHKAIPVSHSHGWSKGHGHGYGHGHGWSLW
ncbi:probable serine/threonine-protein kinase DDB_G0282963 [Maniola jurtina]|uniref:probable serine/threonine-protein kinase DDB_G0282963 n=1 Tax=Maniola jurtina TaxID=191418 RepID=UPI001E68E249|nr:probable serine/threonine-protein kinase DDB_G0282963 [Maniola jurtina]